MSGYYPDGCSHNTPGAPWNEPMEEPCENCGEYESQGTCICEECVICGERAECNEVHMCENCEND